MKHNFYDVKTRSKVEAEVTDKVAYPGKSGVRYAFEGRTKDGRRLVSFVSKDIWERAEV